jgi:L-alanine-DL-glutamate epimerase-like enolase superfamily enzyme
MRVTGLAAHVARNDLGGRLWNPKIRWRTKWSVLVRLCAEDGSEGIGECWCFDSAPDALLAFLRTEVAPHVVGAEVGEREALWRAVHDRATLAARHGILASALSGVDIALCDLAARAEGLPLCRYLGGRPAPVRLYASGGLYAEDKPPEALARELAGYVGLGFRAVKMKVGGLTPDADRARVLAAREAIGADVGLIIDGVYSYTLATAAAFFASVRDAGIHAFQSPLPADRIDEMAVLVAEHGVPVMAAEAEYRHEIFELMLERRSVAILQFALVACGGITAAQQLVRRAGAAGIPCSLEVSSTAVAEMAALHFAAANDGIGSVEYHMLHQALFDALPFGAADLVAGRLAPPPAPGLGIAVGAVLAPEAFRLGRVPG